jgi:hypothetical protein
VLGTSASSTGFATLMYYVCLLTEVYVLVCSTGGLQIVLQLLATDGCPQDVSCHLLMVLSELAREPSVK